MRTFPCSIGLALLAAPGVNLLPAEQPDTLSQTRPGPPMAHRFGASVAVAATGTINYSTRVVVGAPGDATLPELPNAGRIYSYDSFWGNTTVNNPNPEADAQFGYAVACSSSRVVVGSPKDDTGAVDAGSASVAGFTLLNPTPEAGDLFGTAVALSGTHVVVGASLDDTGAPDAGSAYVYDLSNGTPTIPVATLNNPNPGAGDWFGHSVAISGTRIVVGAPHRDAGANNAGSAFVYDLSTATPTVPVAVINNPAPAADDNFGKAVGISGSRVTVGAPGSGIDDTGSVYVYDTLPAILTATLNNPSPLPAGGTFGYAVAISGARVVVGTGSSNNAYVYDVSGSPPATPVAILANPDPGANHQFGASVAIDGTTVAVGAPANDPAGTGAAYVFTSGWGMAEATDFPGPWTNGGGLPVKTGFWEGQKLMTLDGVDAVRGYVWGRSYQATWMETTVTGPTTLYFSHRVVDAYGPIGGEGFSVRVGNAARVVLVPSNGIFDAVQDTGWREASVAIPDGVQNVRWQLYYLNGDSDARVYLDQVWTSDDARPRITDVSKPGVAWATLFSWKVPISSSTPATLSAETLPPGLDVDPNSHVISGTPTLAGSFNARLTASNAGGRHTVQSMFHVEPGTATLAEGLDLEGVVFSQSNGNPSDLPPGGGPAWTGGTGLGHGMDCVRGWAGSFFRENALSSVFQGPGTLAFWYRCGALEGETTGAAFPALGFSVAGVPELGTGLPNTSWTKVTKDLPAGPQTVSWKAGYTSRDLNFAQQRYVYLDRVTFVPPGSAAIVVEVQPSQTSVPNGGNQSFGDVFLASSRSRFFALKNTGLTSLTGLTTTIDGLNATDFTVTSHPVAPVSGPAGSTSLMVKFAPGSAGSKTATLHIASNDPDDNPFEIKLSGTGIEHVNRIVDQGAPVSFSANPAAGASVQWLKDGVDIPGATGSTLTLSSVQPWQIGVYSARVTTESTSSIIHGVSLGLTGVPTEIWRGLVACYPFDTGPHDLCRPGKPASLVNTTELATDAQRGGIVHVQGKGYIVPPLEGEPAETRGPGGYVQIPRPPLVQGEPFTISLLIKEEGFSYWHGESLFTMGEGTTSVELLSHYWIGHAAENYGGPAGPIEPHTSDFILNGSAVAFNHPAWTAYTIAGEGTTLRYYRNGQLIGTTAFPKATAGDFFIGRHWWMDAQLLYSTRLIAKIDDLRLYNRALSAAEVQQLYTQAQTTPPVGSFEAWVLIHGLVGAAAGVNADGDRDNLTNWEEFCFGTSPAHGTEQSVTAGLTNGTLTLMWFQRSGVLYSLQESPDLHGAWATSLIVPAVSADQTGVPPGYQRMQAVIPVPQLGMPSASRFFRVEASKAP